MSTTEAPPDRTTSVAVERHSADGASARTRRLSAVAVIAQALLIFVPLVVLGAAIEWPGSLDDPADVALPRLLDNEVAVRVGYLAYLLYSVAFLPVAIIVHRWIRRRSAVSSPSHDDVGLQIAIGMAAASALARSIGIVRWLSTMLPMAEQWDAASTAERTVLAAQFTSLNDYGGTIGEVLGVSVFAAVWLAVTTVGRHAVRPRWISISGAVVSLLLLAPAVELAGVDAGPMVSVSSFSITVWLTAIGIAMFRSASTDAAAS